MIDIKNVQKRKEIKKMTERRKENSKQERGGKNK